MVYAKVSAGYLLASGYKPFVVGAADSYYESLSRISHILKGCIRVFVAVYIIIYS
jgi:hypothetical protein